MRKQDRLDFCTGPSEPFDACPLKRIRLIPQLAAALTGQGPIGPFHTSAFDDPGFAKLSCYFIFPPTSSPTWFPKSCPTEGRDLSVPGRKRHRIRHLEFATPAVNRMLYASSRCATDNLRTTKRGETTFLVMVLSFPQKNIALCLRSSTRMHGPLLLFHC